MKSKFSKSEAEAKIKDFFSHIKHKTPEEIRKIKKLAMSRKIKLGDKRKLFCKKCLAPFVKSSISIKKGFLTIECNNCNYKSRWKLKDEIDFGINHEEAGCC